MAKYYKEDSELGYIEDSTKIEYLKLNNLRHTVLGSMLGDFDEQGLYAISPEIQQELISMPKFIVESMDNIEICHGAIMLDKPITFMVTFESDRATLSLIEKLSYEANNKIDSGSYSNINEFILDEVETSGVVDRNLIYKRWNIGEFGGQVLDIANMDATTLALYAGLVNRYKYLLVAKTKILEKEEALEEIEATYSTRVLEILTAYPKLKEIVDAEIKADLTEKNKFIRIDKPNFAKTLNEVIDQAIEDNLYVLPEEEQNMFKEEHRSAILERNMAMQQELEIKTQPSSLEEVNQTEFDEVIELERSTKKLVIDTKNEEASITIGEALEKYTEVKKKTETNAQQTAVDYFETKTEQTEKPATTTPKQAKGEEVKQPVKVATTAKAKLIKLLEDEHKIPMEENVGEQTKKKIGVTPTKKQEVTQTQTGEVKQAPATASAAASAKPASAKPANKKAPAKKAAPKKAAATKPAAKKAAAPATKPVAEEPKKEEPKKDEAKKPTHTYTGEYRAPAPTTSTTTSTGGGMVGKMINGNNQTAEPPKSPDPTDNKSNRVTGMSAEELNRLKTLRESNVSSTVQRETPQKQNGRKVGSATGKYVVNAVSQALPDAVKPFVSAAIRAASKIDENTNNNGI